jgi:F-type H+-transporting ATPase subunit b
MLATIASILAQAQEQVEENDPKDLYPHANELIVGAIAFFILFFFMWRWVLPRVNAILEERRKKIQGEMEQAEGTRKEADKVLENYRQQLAGARDEGNRIIEEARATAEQLRQDLQAKAEEEARATVARAQDEIRAERDRAFQELRSQVGTIAVELAERVVGQALDEKAHARLIDEYIDEVAAGDRGSVNGNGSAKGSDEGEG